MLVIDDKGDQVPGFQVHLGGRLGLEDGFGRKLRDHKVTSVGLTDYIERVVRTYLRQRVSDEDFAGWAARADEGVLRVD